MNFMYLDNAGILHGVKDAKTAAEFAKDGKFVPVDAEVANGYVRVNNKDITAEELIKMLPFLAVLNGFSKIK